MSIMMMLMMMMILNVDANDDVDADDIGRLLKGLKWHSLCSN